MEQLAQLVDRDSQEETSRYKQITKYIHIYQWPTFFVSSNIVAHLTAAPTCFICLRNNETLMLNQFPNYIELHSHTRVHSHCHITTDCCIYQHKAVSKESNTR